MKNQQLDQLLRNVSVPEREESYWTAFPGRVMARLRGRQSRDRAAEPPKAGVGASAWSRLGWRLPTPGRLGFKPLWAAALVVAGLVLGLALGHWQARRAGGREPQLAAVEQYYRELAALFPHQIRAIVFDARGGARLELAERADVPVSPPLYLRIRGPEGCRDLVTFSGQAIRLDGESCEVLLSRSGTVLLVGEKSVWSSSEPAAKPGRYRIEARPLYKTS